MKAEELQVGNWVNFPNKYGEPQYYRISGIEKSKNKSSDDIDQFYFDVPHGKPSCGTLGMNLKPIPITAEILKKNNIRLLHGFYCSYEWLNNGYDHGSIHCEPEYGGAYYFKLCAPEDPGDMALEGRFKFVHELQKALRLCKIDIEIKL